MNEMHPLRRFDLATALLLRRPSLMSTDDISGLPQTDFRSETVRAYVDLLAQRIYDWNVRFPGEIWLQPKVDVAHGTMIVWANARKFRVVLSWGSDGWDLRSCGRLADRRDPLAFAVKWAVSGSVLALPNRVRADLDLYSRTMARLIIAGVDPSDAVRLHQPIPATTCASWMSKVWSHICTSASNGDLLFARALATSM